MRSWLRLRQVPWNNGILFSCSSTGMKQAKWQNFQSQAYFPDTGMGLERLSSVNTGWQTMTRIFSPDKIMHRVADLSGRSIGILPFEKWRCHESYRRPQQGRASRDASPSSQTRAECAASLRRIMRSRAIRYGRNPGLMNLFHETARVVFDIMEGTYPARV